MDQSLKETLLQRIEFLTIAPAGDPVAGYAEELPAASASVLRALRRWGPNVELVAVAAVAGVVVVAVVDFDAAILLRENPAVSESPREPHRATAASLRPDHFQDSIPPGLPPSQRAYPS